VGIAARHGLCVAGGRAELASEGRGGGSGPLRFVHVPSVHVCFLYVRSATDHPVHVRSATDYFVYVRTRPAGNHAGPAAGGDRTQD
jgi:hypothetical protein